MENQEINDRLAAIESEIKAIPKIQADIVALQAELKVLGAGMSHVEGNISELGQGQKRMEQAIAEIHASQAEVSGLLKLLVALPERVDKQAQRISWLYGLITAAILFAGAYKFIPWP